ncbi:MAG: caspase family protein, partial [Bacteroidota bacterium]
TDSGYLGLYSLSGEKIKDFTGHHQLIHSLDFSPDGKWILSGSHDNTLKTWDTESGKEIATLALTMSRESKPWEPLSNWMVTEPKGLFDASQGSMDLMHYVQGLDVVDIGQMKERYFEPGLLSKLLGHNSEPLRDVGAINQRLELYPEVSTVLTGDRLAISLTPREGGMGRVALYIGQKEVATDVNPARRASFQVDLKEYQGYFPLGTPTRVAVEAWDKEGFLKSSPQEVSYTLLTRERGGGALPQRPSASFKEKPSLFVLAVGTGDYVGGESLDLSYAEQDAREMAQILTLSGEKLFPGNSVTVHRLLTGESNSLPSKTNVKAKLTEMADKVQPQDVVVLYFSGHGKTYEDQWYYLTYEMSSDILTDKAVRESKAISSRELKEWLGKMKAQKQVLILDACNSGKLNQDFDLLSEKTITSSQVRALDRLGQRAGLYIISASTADQVSYEASPYGMGLLTYALLQGMSGSSLRQQEFIDVNLLFSHAEETVPKLADYINKTQKPMTYAPEGSASFDIGRVTPQVANQVNLSAPKPIFYSSTFVDPKKFYKDHLEVGQSVNSLLREYNYKGARSPIIYVEREKIPNAYHIVGSYSLEGELLVVEANLFLGDSSDPLGQSVKVSGSGDDLSSLGKKLIQQILANIP